MTTLGWMVYALAVSALFASAAGLLDRGLSRSGIPNRWGWFVAMILCVVVPIAEFATSRGDVDGSSVVGAPIGVDAGSSVPPVEGNSPEGPPLAVERMTRRVEAAVNGFITGVASRLPRSHAWSRWIFGFWILGSAGVGLVMFASWMGLVRRSRGWPSTERHGRQVRVSPDLGPAAMGLLRPTIVIPRWALALGPLELSMVLDHEDEHVRAKDPLVSVLALLLAIAIAWNPVMWWMLRRFRDALELDCDQRVLDRGRPTASYAHLLLDLGTRTDRAFVPALAMSNSPSLLERRLKAMKKRSPIRVIPGIAAAGVAAVILVSVACTAAPPVAETPAEELEAVGVVDLDSDNPTESNDDDVEAGDSEVPIAESVGAYERVRVIRRPTLPRDDSTGSTPTVIGRVSRPDDSGSREVRGVVSRPATNTQDDSTPSPLIVVDGVVMDSGFDISAYDIESIEVIRGEAATLIYGDRAAPGVIRITTVEGAGDRETEPNPGPAPSPEREPEPNPEPEPAPDTAASPEPAPRPISGPSPEPAPELRRPVSVRSVRQDPLAQTPVLTPMTVAPQVLNAAAMQVALDREYPLELRNEGIGGTVIVHVFIGANGAIGNALVAQGSERPELDEAAVRVAWQFEFSPAMDGDEPIPVWIQIPVTFVTN